MKKQLNTMEEVIKALKEGKEIIVEPKKWQPNIPNTEKFKMIDDIICCRECINTSFHFLKDINNYFIEVEWYKCS